MANPFISFTQPAAQPAQVSSGPLSFDQIQQLWVSAGGDPRYARVMAHVAMAESSGDPASNRSGRTSYVENGKTYYPQGLWQISTVHGLSNMFDPMANAKAAVNLFNSQHMEPWEASRNGGAGGGWGQYYASDLSGQPQGRRVAGRFPQLPIYSGFLYPRGNVRTEPAIDYAHVAYAGVPSNPFVQAASGPAAPAPTPTPAATAATPAEASNPYLQAASAPAAAAPTPTPAALPATNPFVIPPATPDQASRARALASLSSGGPPRPSVIRSIAEELGMPISLLSAAWQSTPGLAPAQRQNYLQDAFNILGTPGKPLYERVQELNSKYGITSTATEARYGVPQHAHPWIEAAGELGAQWYNPTWSFAGRTAGLFGQGAKYVTKSVPGLTPLAEAGGALSHVVGRMTEPFTDAASAVLNGIGRAARAGLKIIPGIPGDVVNSFVNRYAGLSVRGGAAYTQAALAANAAPEHAAAMGDKFLDQMAEGLSLPQQREVQRMSNTDNYGVPTETRDPAIPEPAKGPTLEQRAVAVRRYIIGRSSISNILGIRVYTEEVAPSAKELARNPNVKPTFRKGTLSDPNTFWPMRRFNDHPVYTGQVKPKPGEKLGTEVELTGAPKATRGRSKFSAGVAKTGHKTKGPLLTPEDWADIHPEYVPFYQLKEQFREVNEAIANEASRRGLEELPSIDPETGQQRFLNVPGEGSVPMTARMPLFYGLLQREEPQIFGRGEAGARAMQTYIERKAQAKAADLARQDPAVIAQARAAGVNPELLGTRKVTNVRTSPAAARLLESKAATKRSGALLRALEGRAQRLMQREEELQGIQTSARTASKAKTTAKTTEDAAAAAAARNAAIKRDRGPVPLAKASSATEESIRAAIRTKGQLVDRMTARVQKLQQDFEQRAATSGTARAFQDAKDQYYKNVVDTVRQEIEAEAEKTLVPEGYTVESTLGIGTPTSRDMALDDSWANYLVGAKMPSFEDESQAKLFWNTMQVMNRLARLSIVLIPTVHGINNLGMAFLSEGGTPQEMFDILTRRKKWDQSLKNAAFDSAAATDWSRTAFGVNEQGPLSTLPGREQARIISERGGPFSKISSKLNYTGLGAENVYNRANQWLFRDVEQGYAFTLFDKFRRQGMSDGEAATRVRNALGRYDNVSPREQALGLNKIFYFYPWMKTVVPFWTKKGIVDPKWWGAPVQAIQALNEAQGYDDPSKAFTMTIANLGGGKYLRAIAPVPQRVVEPIANLLRTIPDLADSLRGNKSMGDIFTQDITPSGRYVLGHLNPALNIGIQGTTALAEGTERVAPYNTFRTEPGETFGEAAPALASRIAGDVFAPLQRGTTLGADPAATFAGYLLGSFMYIQKDGGRKYAEQVIRRKIDGIFSKSIHAAKLSGDITVIRQLQRKRDTLVQTVLQQADEAKTLPKAPPETTAPVPTAAPAAQGNPFIQAASP